MPHKNVLLVLLLSVLVACTASGAVELADWHVEYTYDKSTGRVSVSVTGPPFDTAHVAEGATDFMGDFQVHDIHPISGDGSVSFTMNPLTEIATIAITNGQSTEIHVLKRKC